MKRHSVTPLHTYGA